MMILSNFKHVTFGHIFLRKSFNQNTSNAIDVFTKTFVLVPHHPSSTRSEPFGNPIEYRVFRHSFWQLHNKTEAYFVYRRSPFIDKTRSKHFDKPARISLLHLWMTLMVIYYLHFSLDGQFPRTKIALSKWFILLIIILLLNTTIAQFIPCYICK